MTEEAQGAGLLGNIGSGAFGALFGRGRRLSRVAETLWAKFWIPESQGLGRPGGIPHFNFASNSSQK